MMLLFFFLVLLNSIFNALNNNLRIISPTVIDFAVHHYNVLKNYPGHPGVTLIGPFIAQN